MGYVQAYVQSKVYREEENEVDDPTQQKGDELRDVETIKNTVVRAARVIKMQRSMDNVSAATEMNLMLQEIEAGDAKTEHHLLNFQGTACDIIDAFEREKTSINFALDGSAVELLQRLETVRAEAAEIKQDLAALKGAEQKEVYLLQRFLSSSLVGLARDVAEGILYSDMVAEDDPQSDVFWQYVALVLLPLYFTSLSFYIFLFGVQIGSKATTHWLLGSFAALMMDMFILSPVKIWLQRIAITGMT